MLNVVLRCVPHKIVVSQNKQQQTARKVNLIVNENKSDSKKKLNITRMKT